MLPSFDRSSTPVFVAWHHRLATRVAIHNYVAKRAAIFEVQTGDSIEENKSERLKDIEVRYAIDQIRKEQQAKGNSWH